MARISELQQNAIVLIVDLASNSGRSSPHTALGRIISFLDNSNSQAVVRYHGGQVDRPIGKLVRIVKSGEQISKKGQGICPLAQADEEIQAVWAQEEQSLPDRGPAEDDESEQE